MRENRLYGSEGGGAGYSTGPSYPYPGCRHRHSTAASELPPLVTCGCHDYSFFRLAANQHRLATKLWLVELFDGREERIHIDMQDVAGLAHRRRLYSKRRHDPPLVVIHRTGHAEHNGMMIRIVPSEAVVVVGIAGL